MAWNTVFLFICFSQLCSCIVFLSNSTTNGNLGSTQPPNTTTPTTNRNLGNLTLCAMVRDEMPYIIEWIEYYRLQGVDKFILYDDGSMDDTLLIQHLYTSMQLEDLIEIIPANVYRRNRPSHHDFLDHTQTQMHVLDHCNRRCINRTEWVMMVDVDEFIHSPTYGTVWAFIQSQKSQTEVTSTKPLNCNTLSQFSIDAVRYGSSGMEMDFRGHLDISPYVGSMTIVAQAPKVYANGSFPLLLTANPNRAPREGLDNDYYRVYSKICRQPKNPSGCMHALGKSIWKPERCGMAGVHWCERDLMGRTETPDVKDVRENHYAFKSREHVERLIDVMKPTKKAAFDDFDGSWFSLRNDPMNARIVASVKLALSKMQTINVRV